MRSVSLSGRSYCHSTNFRDSRHLISFLYIGLPRECVGIPRMMLGCHNNVPKRRRDHPPQGRARLAIFSNFRVTM